ncbi:integrase [Xanthomonas sacchari]|uniref:tyrosine-type recombinase/integrase n=1 Tax=Xanthomonas sacchari TaxID=56458 RepID=UPI002787DF06|nr:tyrosine-type recombinase/integrase [Xanthomonas sacchari]MDQ1090655.1 integrase [Xanthomonas sacchari]
MNDGKLRGRGKSATTVIKRVRATSPFLRPGDTAPPSPSVQVALQALEVLPAPHSSALELADLPVIVPGVRFELSADQLGQAKSIFRDLFKHEIKPYADNSRKSIRADWRHWIAFCAERDRVCMPVQLDDLVEFLTALIDAGYKRASLDHLLFTLKLASRLWSCACPTETMQFRWFWRQQARECLSKRQHQATGLNIERVRDLYDVAPDAPLLELRDAAFVATAYDLLARGGEMVAIEWRHVQFDVDEAGGALCLIERAKADQEGEGAKKYLVPATAHLLKRWSSRKAEALDLLWEDAQGELLANPFVFHRVPRYRMFKPKPAAEATRLKWNLPLTTREADRILKRAMGAAYSSHSARVGAAQDMTRAGMELPAIMQQGRWTTPTMPARYAENELAARAGQSREAALNRLVRKQ